MDGRLIWTDCDEAGYYVVPNVLSPRDLVSRPDNMDETVPHTHVSYMTTSLLFFTGKCFVSAFSGDLGLSFGVFLKKHCYYTR